MEVAPAAAPTYADADARQASAVATFEKAQKDLRLDAEEWNNRLHPLHCAVILGYAECARLLLDAGAPPNQGLVSGEPDDERPKVRPVHSLYL